MKCTMLLATGILALLAAPMAGHHPRAVVLGESQSVDLPIGYDIDRSDVPLVLIGQLLGGTRIPGGIAQLEGCSGVPVLHLTAKRGMTIREAMDALVSENPSYQWQLEGGVVNLIPRSGSAALLDAKIRSFQLNTTDQKMDAHAVLYDIIRVPEVRQRAAELKLQPGMMQGGPGVYDEHPAKREPVPIMISLKDVSLREAFNSVVRTYGHTIWIYREHECNGSKTYIMQAETD
jgi:hypothetical protein